MSNELPCPAPVQLRALLDGELPESEQIGLTQHLDDCDACRRKLEELAAGKETWAGLARQLGAGRPEHSPELELVMDELRNSSGGAPDRVEPPVEMELPSGFLSPPSQPDHLGKLDHYEILESVGRGAMGMVFRARDDRLQRIVAIKVMSPQLAASGTARRRFVREARAAAAVCHDHVVTIYSVEQGCTPPYLVMQFIGGKSLQDRIDQSGPLAVPEILRIGMQTAAGLAAAHAQGLVHRDIKPANILLENGVERVKITDFGLARAVDDASLTQTGMIAGTPQYMAPEQARGETIDYRADLFSLGSVLYTLCTGRAPFRATTMLGVIKRVCEDAPRPIRDINPEIPDWLAAIVERLLAKDPAERFQSAQEVADLLGGYLAGVQQAGPFTSTPRQSTSPRHVDSAAEEPSPVTSASASQAPIARFEGTRVGSRQAIAFLAVLTALVPIIHGLRAIGVLTYETAETAGLGANAAAWMALCAFLAIATGQRIRNRSWKGSILGGWPVLPILIFASLNLFNGRSLISSRGNTASPPFHDGTFHPSGVMPVTRPAPEVIVPPSDAEIESQDLDGRWIVVSQESGGSQVPSLESEPGWFEFEGTRRREMTPSGQLIEGRIGLRTQTDPWQVDWFDSNGKPILVGICRVEKDSLLLTLVPAGQLRPSEFRTWLKSEAQLYVCRRARTDTQALQGRWNVVSQNSHGELLEPPQRDAWWEFQGHRMQRAGVSDWLRVEVEHGGDPNRIDLLNSQGTRVSAGIYRLDGDEMVICMATPGQRPKSIPTLALGGQVLTVLRRVGLPGDVLKSSDE